MARTKEDVAADEAAAAAEKKPDVLKPSENGVVKTPTKRGRGRPRKPDSEKKTPKPSGRPRGRPKGSVSKAKAPATSRAANKRVVKPALLATESVPSVATKTPTKKGAKRRGRPSAASKAEA